MCIRGTALALSCWPLTFPGSLIGLCKAFILILTRLLHRHVILKSIKSDILLDWSHFLIAPIHLSLCSHSTSLSLSQMTSIGFLSSGHTECVRNVCELQTASCWIHSPFCAFLSRCQLYPANYPPSHKLVSERERERRGRQTDWERFRLTARSAWLPLWVQLTFITLMQSIKFWSYFCRIFREYLRNIMSSVKFSQRTFNLFLFFF